MRTLLIDNHGSYTRNLFHLLGQVNGEEPVVLANDAARISEVDLDRYDNVVLTPGPGHPARPRDFGVCADVLRTARLPVLGVCLGHQGLVVSAGGQVVAAPRARHGQVSRVTHDGDALFAGMPSPFAAVRYHSLCAAEPLPQDLEVTARAEDGVVMALRHRYLPRWGVQFHPESVSTEHGARLLANFRDLTRAAHRRTRALPRRRPVPAPSVPPPDHRRQAEDHRRQAEEQSRTDPPVRYTAHVQVLDTPVDAEAAFQACYASSRHAFWLDSARVERGLSRFSFLGDASGPLAEVLTYRVADRRVVAHSTPPRTYPGTVLDHLKGELARREVDAPPLPFDFVGGYVGYFGYELKADCGSPNRHAAETPDAVWVFADRFLAVDHAHHRTYLVALSTDGATAADAARWLADTARTLTRLAPPTPVAPPPAAAGPEPRWAQGRDAYLRSVAACKEQLVAGESYEICLTNVAEVPATDGGWDTYRRLRRLNPAPYAAYLRLDDVQVACSSPERFLRVTRDGVVETKPIKGTAPRADDPGEDAAARRELASQAKTRAENLMIVDLLRDDLGRVCELGSVHVPVLMEVESYATVHQLVSTVRGTLKPGNDVIDCVRACFPGGSMTGAPKPRTLEIIESLEERARGIYSGTIGYLGCNGTADLNIVIRTMVLAGGRWLVGAGGAVVMDSDPAEEYAEMLLKADAPARALYRSRRGLHHAPPAVHHQTGAGDVRGLGGGEEHDGRGDLVRAAEAAGGGLRDARLPFLLGHPVPHPGEDRPRQHGVDPYLGPVLDGELAAQREQPSLGSRVGGVAGDSAVGVDGGHQDHGAPLGAQVLEEGPHAEEGGGQPHGELPVPGVRGGQVRRGDLDPHRVADQHADRSEPVGGRQDLGPPLLAPHVRGDGDGPAAALGDLPGDQRAPRPVDVGDDDRGALRGEAARGGGTDARRGAGDDGRPAGETAGTRARCHRGSSHPGPPGAGTRGTPVDRA